MEKSTGTKIFEYMEQNHIDKKTIADKMEISVKKLDKMLSWSDDKMNCLHYYKLVVALGVSADLFFE